ncbi:MAG: XdhC family protein [Alphaproteobacteria bacterium]|nr:XdhC family protein [Alphaproteobacteria bacterium]
MTSVHQPVDETAPLDVLGAARSWLMAGRPVAIATVVDTWGSAPVAVGGQMVVASETEFQGSVSGGCVEADVIVAALQVIANNRLERLEFGVSDETAWNVGLPCGGRIAVMVEPFSCEADLALITRLIAARQERREIFVATRLTTGNRTVHEMTSSLPQPLRSAIEPTRSALVATPTGDVFVHAHLPKPRLFIIGATHIAQATVAISDILGLDCTVIDPREAFTSKTRFENTPVLNAWPQDALSEIQLDTFTAIVALAHVAHIDDEALKIGIRSQAGYIGALGSTRNHAKRVARLEGAGFTAEEITRIHCPIGLDIGAITPEEIALSLVAEAILAFRGAKRNNAGST